MNNQEYEALVKRCKQVAQDYDISAHTARLRDKFSEAIQSNRLAVAGFFRTIREDNDLSIAAMAADLELSEQTLTAIDNATSNDVDMATIAYAAAFYNYKFSISTTPVPKSEMEAKGLGHDLKQELRAKINLGSLEDRRNTYKSIGETLGGINFRNGITATIRDSGLKKPEVANKTGLSNDWLVAAQMGMISPEDATVDFATVFAEELGQKCVLNYGKVPA